MIDKILNVSRRNIASCLRAIENIREGTESTSTPAGRVLNDRLAYVEEKQDRTLSDEKLAEEIRAFCVIYYADGAQTAYIHTTRASCQAEPP